jgi:arsenate reductase
VSDKIYNTLFICTGNSARSIMAEAILNQMGKGRFRAYSAGSHPRGEVHPLALQVLSTRGYPIDGLRSKSWDEFARSDAPKMDFIFTVCDRAAGETCPAWPGQPITAHWGFADPVAASGDPDQQLKVFANTQFQIAARIRTFLSLPLARIDRLSLQHQLRQMGEDPG